MRDYPCLELVSTPIYRVEVLKGHGFSRAVNLRNDPGIR